MFTIIDYTNSYEYEKYTLKYVKIKYRKQNFSIIIQQSQTKTNINDCYISYTSPIIISKIFNVKSAFLFHCHIYNDLSVNT